jgi:hypothetical protein
VSDHARDARGEQHEDQQDQKPHSVAGERLERQWSDALSSSRRAHDTTMGGTIGGVERFSVSTTADRSGAGVP